MTKPTHRITRNRAASALAAAILMATGPAAGQGTSGAILTVQADRIYAAAPLSFGRKLGDHLRLYDDTFTIGIQPYTMFFRSDTDFAWYTGGRSVDIETRPKPDRPAMMLSSGTPDMLAVNGRITGMGTVPERAIMMWSGNEDKLPKGWVLCDGQNETPDLRGRFIVGAGGEGGYAVNDTGGSKTHAHEPPAQPFYSGNHKHDPNGGGISHTDRPWNGAHKQWVTLDMQGDSKCRKETHDAVLADWDYEKCPWTRGADHLPPFYALAYIQYRPDLKQAP